jgi:hypothetical protein
LIDQSQCNWDTIGIRSFFEGAEMIREISASGGRGSFRELSPIEMLTKFGKLVEDRVWNALDC